MPIISSLAFSSAENGDSITYSIVFGIKSKKNILVVLSVEFKLLRMSVFLLKKSLRVSVIRCCGEGERSASRFPLFGSDLGNVSDSSILLPLRRAQTKVIVEDTTLQLARRKSIRVFNYENNISLDIFRFLFLEIQ